MNEKVLELTKQLEQLVAAIKPPKVSGEAMLSVTFEAGYIAGKQQAYNVVVNRLKEIIR